MSIASRGVAASISLVSIVLVLTILAGPASAQGDGDAQDYGDAPEGVLAYPSIGVFGQFPTCLNVGPQSWVRHGLGLARFYSVPTPPQQGKWDPDGNGNGGFCPSFAPYDNDECWDDGDAGLITPTAFTIAGGSVQPCPNVLVSASLGNACGTAQITARVENIMPNNTTGFINVLFDWDRDGRWSGGWPCTPNITAPEHAVVDDPLPNGFDGVWTSPSFRLGTNGDAYVWMRLMISNVQVGANWGGAGDFEDGESEDYLVHVRMGSVPVIESSWGALKSVYR